LRHVARSISGVICAKAAMFFCRRSSSFCDLCPYTSVLTYPYTKKSGAVKSAMFVSHALAPPRGQAAEPPVNPPFIRHGHPSRSYSNKLLRDKCIDFLYTTVYFSDISNASPCIIKHIG
jgi:hypothetical protein